MKRTKEQKGITLVALVVTIIVLLILAGITLSTVLGNNGLIQKTKSAAQAYQNAAITEKGEMNNAAGFIDNMSSKMSNIYNRGQVVKVGQESFYVLEDSDASQSTVTLFAMYNLNQAGTQQAPNASYTETMCKFSDKNYWASEYNAYNNWGTKKLDIYEINKEEEGDAIYKAKQYAKIVSGDNNNTSGRLLTYEEFDALKTNYSDMIWGKANHQVTQANSDFLLYWTSSSYQDTISDWEWWVYVVNGESECWGYNKYSEDGFGGVRPVITVSKSLLS